MAYASVAWEITTDDAGTRDRIDGAVRSALRTTSPEAMADRIVIFDSDPVDLDSILSALDALANQNPELRWVLFNMRDRTLSTGWVGSTYDEARGYAMSGSSNYPLVRGRQ